MHFIRGKCLCGAVGFTANVAHTNLFACHCTICQKWSCGPSICLGHDGPVLFEGSEYITTYRSSEWAVRAFCKVCGTSLYWHHQGGQHYAISAGTLEDQDSLRLAGQLFIDQKPAYYDFGNETPKLTRDQVFTVFNAS